MYIYFTVETHFLFVGKVGKFYDNFQGEIEFQTGNNGSHYNFMAIPFRESSFE